METRIAHGVCEYTTQLAINDHIIIELAGMVLSGVLVLAGVKEAAILNLVQEIINLLLVLSGTVVLQTVV